MRLLVLMYHRARAGPDGNSPEMLDRHFRVIDRCYRNVLPGDSLAEEVLNVCLVFDDGYYDFHSVVLPLLRKHGLCAVLAVSPGLLRERCDLPPYERLSAPSEGAMADSRLGGLCTWPEVLALSQSGHVMVAAHGYTHSAMDRPGLDLGVELHMPKLVLDSRLRTPVSSFVFPYGRFSRRAIGEGRRAYPHLFRIGTALNTNWNGRLLYRVGADNLSSPDEPFAPGRLAACRARGWWNRLRGR